MAVLQGVILGYIGFSLINQSIWVKYIDHEFGQRYFHGKLKYQISSSLHLFEIEKGVDQDFIQTECYRLQLKVEN